MRVKLTHNHQALKFKLYGGHMASILWTYILLILFLSDLHAEEVISHEGVWKEFRNMNGIVGHERTLPGTTYIETRSVTVIDKPIDFLWGIIKDVGSYPEWMYRCTDAELISERGDLNRTLYFSQGVPFGSPDRQVITGVVATKSENPVIYDVKVFSLDHEDYDISIDRITENRQWMNEFRGRWILQRQDNNRTKVSYTAYTDPGGFAPTFIVNRVIRNVTFNSLAGMIKRTKELNAVNLNYIEDELHNSVRLYNAPREKSPD